MKLTVLYLSHTTRYPLQKLVSRYILTYLHSSTRVKTRSSQYTSNSKPRLSSSDQRFIFIVPVKQNIIKTHTSEDVQPHDHSFLVCVWNGDTWWNRALSKWKWFITRIRLNHSGEKKICRGYFFGSFCFILPKFHFILLFWEALMNKGG